MKQKKTENNSAGLDPATKDTPKSREEGNQSSDKDLNGCSCAQTIPAGAVPASDPNPAPSQAPGAEPAKNDSARPNRPTTFRREAKRYAFMLLGCILYASSFHAFFTPHAIVAGGVSGLASIFYLTLGWPVGLMNILINIPILIMGLKIKGWAFILRCLITTVCLGIFTDLFALVPSITDNALLAAMYGGILQGLGIGLFIKYEVSSGGTELLGRISQHFLPLGSIPFHVAFWDGLVVVIGSIVMRNPENILYALIIIFISAKLSDLVVTGLNKAKLCYVITEHADELSAYLLSHSPRGVTLLEGKGMYTGQPKGVLMTCVKANQLSALRTAVKEVDPQAFVIVNDANEVYGKGFYQM